ncbi:hypothetical protein GCM10028806_35060 [Spirosoma terrae]|uniref:FHA domain-containing protein n=1 Tax=Spirosoma terrae TaxID=1968276 RepID=A0A6L9LF92_9BACT|nr:FHA domain-containing protein [Spirosoma terrae]NDU97543.1 FHA domain-containing protein [Spirosoma terrae]
MAKKYSIGRNPENTFSYPAEKTVSGIHAYLTLIAQNELLIQDNGSTNGTYVNGQPVSSYSLYPGDRLRLGNLWVDVDDLLKEIMNREFTGTRKPTNSLNRPAPADVSDQFLELKGVLEKYRRHLAEIDLLKEGTIVDKVMRIASFGVITKTNKINIRELDQQLKDWFKATYVCPNCKIHLNEFPFEALQKQKFCRSCKAIWAK